MVGAISIKRGYTAIDPAETLLTCRCGKPECRIPMLRPLRDHMAILLRAIVSCGVEELLPGYSRGDEPWPGVLYPLQMAASIEDVFANPAFVDDSDSGLFCGHAWDREEEDREQASKYVAAATIFNYTWLAYEAAIDEAAGGRFERDKTPVRGRKLLQLECAQVDALPHLDMHLRMARHFLKGAGSLERSVQSSEAEFPLTGMAAGAELGRLFRNHVVHGRDPMPIDVGLDPVPLARFYAMSKLLLLLVQALVLLRLDDADAVIPLSQNVADRHLRAGALLSRLHLRDEHLFSASD